MAKATHKLEHLSIEEGSLVPAGDNPHAHITLIKVKPGDVDEAPAAVSPTWWERFKSMVKGARIEKDYGDPLTTSQILAANEFQEAIYEVRCAFTQSVWGILNLGDPAKMAPLLAKTVQEFAEESQALVDEMTKSDPTAAAKLRKLFDEVAAQAKAAVEQHTTLQQEDSPTRKALEKACADLESFTPKPSSTQKEGDMPAPNETKKLADVIAALPEEQRKAIQAAHDAEVATAKAKAEEEAKKAAPPAPTEKKEPEVQKSAAEVALEKRLADMEKAAKDAAAEVQKLRDEKALDGYVAKAKDMGLPEPDKIGKVLKSAYDRSEDDGKVLEQTLAASAAQMRDAQKQITKVFGSSQGVVKGSPADQINEAAKELRKADPKLSEAQAYTEACKRNPALYDEMQATAS